MGLILAGVGVTSAKTYFSTDKTVEKNLENYWLETGLGSKELFELVSNENCQSSEKYFLSCINSIIQILPKFHLKISSENGFVSSDNQASIYDGRSEKQNLLPFLQMYEKQNNKLINFEQIWSGLLAKDNAEVSKSYLIATGINAFLSIYKDPHTYIMPSQYFEEVGSRFERSNLFVGVSLEKENSIVYIRKVFKNSDADAAGLKPQDQVLEINGAAVQKMNLFDISTMLKNPDLKTFAVKIKRDGFDQNLQITRSFKKINHVIAEKELGLRNYSVITLSKFSHGVCAEVSKKIKNLSTDNVAGMVLDLRDNPGGELNEAACIAGLFLGINKKIYAIKYFDPLKSDEVALTTGSLLYTGPLVILINASSASASELLAGALQDYNRAVLVGEKTFGKGTFQEGELWKKNSRITLFKTQGFYLLPSGMSPQIKGIKPDLVQEENRVKISEGISFFNPIAANHELDIVKDETFKQTQFAAEFKKCLRTMSFRKDDKILTLGLEVLSCHRISSFMASQYLSDEYN